MSDSSLFTILHLSDFHYQKRRHRDQLMVVDALIKDLQKVCIGHRRPDLVMFTGDLVYAAGIDLHDEAYDFLIDRVSKATGCSDERIFIAAGNHDLSWSGLENFSQKTHDWQSIVGTDDETNRFNEMYEQKIFDAAVQEKFSQYIGLESFLSSGDRAKNRILSNSFVTVDHISAINVDIVTFNTAVLSAGGHKDFGSDKGKMIIPEYAIIEAISKLTKRDHVLRIFVTHHPLSWLSENSSKHLEGEISHHAHIHLFGHMHDPQPKNIVGLKGTVIADQAGAIFSSRKTYYNGYTLLTFDRSNNYMETLVRSYFKDRNEFDNGIDVIEGGHWYSSQEARKHFRTIATPVDETRFRTHLSGPALDALVQRLNMTGGEGHLHHKFVAPPLRRTFIEPDLTENNKVEYEVSVAFEDFVKSDTNLILYARAEYGRTTLLSELRYRLLNEAANLKFPRLPIKIDFVEISANVENLLRKLKASSELAPEGNDVESLLKLGHVCVLIDDVHFVDTRRMRILRELVERYPKARYIFSSPQASATKMGACIDPEMPVRFDFVEIQELRRKDMRQLLTKDDRCTDVEVWLDRLQAEFREINLPFTAANGSILIEILAVKYNFNPINRSVLMEQFVDSTLRKAEFEQSRREIFDYTNKTDLLSYIASWMAQSEEYIPTKEILRTQMKHYIDSRGLNANLDDLLNEFLFARIFVIRPDNCLSFRYKGVLEYFIALRMTTDNEFKNWIMDEERYLNYINEIQYYAGKLRNDRELVDIVAKRHQEILKDAIAEVGEIDLNQLDSIMVPSDTSESSPEAVGHEIAQPPLTQAEKDEELDLELPTDADDRQEISRPRVDRTGDSLTASLILYSGLLKNMELISDPDKRRHLSEIWRGWSILLIGALRLAPRLAKERKLRINGALYEVHAPHGMSDTTLLRRMMVQLPHVHSRMISNTLGTEKLERQLTEPTLTEQAEPKIYEYFRACLIADLRLPSTSSSIRDLADRLRSNRYLLWSLIVHIGHLRRLDRLKEEHFLALQEPLAGAIADLRGGTHNERNDEKRKQLKRLAKDRLLLKMRRSAEG